MQLNLLGLLGRDSLKIPQHESFKGKRVLVTGAGGSIGSAIAKQLVEEAEFVGFIGQSESPIFRLLSDLNSIPPQSQYAWAIEDCANIPINIWRDWAPDVVIHAAAHKHVGLMQSQPGKAFANNTCATLQLALKAFDCGVQNFVFISTDKAVRPSSIMGASKRLAEAWLLARAPWATVCRFGNVAGSSGSLIEIVAEKVAKGEKVTLTSSGMKRYFITPDEAVRLVLSSTFNPGMFTLNMGEPILIEDIIHRIGQQASRCVNLEVTEAGAGEKEDEDLLNPNEYLVNVGGDYCEVRCDKGWPKAAHVDSLIRMVAHGEIGIVDAANHL